jgi:hypothetical protein
VRSKHITALQILHPTNGVFGFTLIAAKAMNLTEIIGTVLLLSTRNLRLSPNTFFQSYGYVSVNICIKIDVFKRQPRVSHKNRRFFFLKKSNQSDTYSEESFLGGLP